MPRYIALLDWTDQGVRSFRESVDRFEAAQREFERFGITFIDNYWTMGEHDVASIVEAPDDETLAAALLVAASQGNVRSTTMRAFSHDEMRRVIEKTAG